MEFVIVAAIGCLIFALCFAVLALKNRKEGPSAKLHMCAHGGECRCEARQDTNNTYETNGCDLRKDA